MEIWGMMGGLRLDKLARSVCCVLTLFDNLIHWRDMRAVWSIVDGSPLHIAPRRIGYIALIWWCGVSFTVCSAFGNFGYWCMTSSFWSSYCDGQVMCRGSNVKVKHLCFSTWEFDPGSERTLAAGLIHASRARPSGWAADGLVTRGNVPFSKE